MLTEIIDDFIHYGNTAGLSDRSLSTLTNRLREFRTFIDQLALASPLEISVFHLQTFVADYGKPSPHVKKSRVWTLHKFFHFLKLKDLITKNSALALPYPKIEKKVPQFLSETQLNEIIGYFGQRTDSVPGLRNFLLVMILCCLGLRISTLIALNREDVDLFAGTIRATDKGNRRRVMVLPEVLCHLLRTYLKTFSSDEGPLFETVRKKRISTRTVQDILQKAADNMGHEIHLHAHLFCHSAATHLNTVAGIIITAEVMGHAHLKNTDHYTHLNPNRYGDYMRRHPCMNFFHSQSPGG
ncbi:tyrosine-type recombinase/integrase [candidate division CSSED10-310 bacterium]|uniref:Tyrosine-type recombinase/integrase n=1 Tax=candidate division CSSED10-310 bacterium TaxID=2855610 RepID=A0ABV6YVZ7_UNCC1